MLAWPAIVVAVGSVSCGGKCVALLSILRLRRTALIPHCAARRHLLRSASVMVCCMVMLRLCTKAFCADHYCPATTAPSQKCRESNRQNASTMHGDNALSSGMSLLHC